VPMSLPESLRPLLAHASTAAANSHAPYSGRPAGAALLLRSGEWIPGVRIENASYPLTIPASVAAYCGARAQGRDDFAALATSEGFMAGEAQALAHAMGFGEVRVSDGVLIGEGEMPALAARVEAVFQAPTSESSGIARAREAARHAYVPASDFPVGCVVADDAGRAVAGCNVEHDDWTRGLCGERVALAIAKSYGFGPITHAYLTCLKDPNGTPCGACRQVIAELMPEADIAIDRGAAAVEHTDAASLLPGSFVFPV
jgi:cytidine deaminase